MKADETPLGRQVPFPQQYSPEMLCALPRKKFRLSGDAAGFDQWNCYEVSWLAPSGTPVSAVARIIYPANSPSIIESKSLKLFLGSMNSHVFEDENAVSAEIEAQIEKLLGGGECRADIFPAAGTDALQPGAPRGVNLEASAARAVRSAAAPLAREEPRDEIFHTNLFRSLCPITGQPDWATVEIAYRGGALEPGALLGYLLSFRDARAFHEECCEKIFSDIAEAQKSTFGELRVACWFLRRGGLDLNPVRFTPGLSIANLPRLVRQ